MTQEPGSASITEWSDNTPIFVLARELVMTVKKGQKISLLGIPSAIVETKGLKWNLDRSELTFPGRSACFNRANQDFFDITVHEGCLLVLHYLEAIDDAGW